MNNHLIENKRCETSDILGGREKEYDTIMA